MYYTTHMVFGWEEQNIGTPNWITKSRIYSPESFYNRIPTEVVLIRPPKGIADSDVYPIIEGLCSNGFIPVVLPSDDASKYGIDHDRFFPTDFIRQIGTTLISSKPDEFEQLNRYVIDSLNLPMERIPQTPILEVPHTFRGGDFIYLTSHKIFIFNSTRILEKDALQVIKKFTDRAFITLLSKSWNVVGMPLDKDDELDFNCSVFLGRDNLPHYIIAEDFHPMEEFLREAIPHQFIHGIPQYEANQGGCNIADLRNGNVLIAPHRTNAPTTVDILMEYANPKTHIIHTPSNWYERLSGARCSISAWSL